MPPQNLTLPSKSTEILPQRDAWPSLQVSSPEGILVKIDEVYEKWASEIQESFERSLDPDFLADYTHYKNVEVLFLSWATELDDLHVKGEIAELRSVFEDLYHFNCVEQTISPGKSAAQIVLTKHVANWLTERDAHGTLSIIYFAGHGTANPETPGKLHLHPNSRPLDVRAYLNEVVWNETENLLNHINGHALQIFDCCSAGAIMKTRSKHRRRIEFLGASKGTTKPPGKQSFTGALIWALRDMVEKNEYPFTTHALKNRIQKFRHFPEQQEPVLDDRVGHSDDGKILLQPLTSEAPSPTESTTDTSKTDSKANVVTLKFVFAAKPTHEDVQALASSLGHIVMKEKMSVNRILWGGVRPKKLDLFYKAVSCFSAPILARRKSGSGDRSQASLTPSLAMVANTVQVIDSKSMREKAPGPGQTWLDFYRSPTVYLGLLIIAGGIFLWQRGDQTRAMLAELLSEAGKA